MDEAINVKLSPSTIARLQAQAVPLVDTFDSVIARILDAYEGKTKTQEAPKYPVAEIKDLDPLNPPDLTHTKVLSAAFCGRPLPAHESNWNGLLNSAVRFAARKAREYEELRRLITVNFIIGRKQDEGYRHLDDVNISVQGQDANSAWRAITHIARHTGCALNVVFVWRQNEDAAFPGQTAQFRMGGSTEGTP